MPDPLSIARIFRASEGLAKAGKRSCLVDTGAPRNQTGHLSGISATTAGLAGRRLPSGW